MRASTKNTLNKILMRRRQIFKISQAKRLTLMLTSVDQINYNNTPQPSPAYNFSPQPSVFTRPTATMPTAMQTPAVTPGSIPQIPLSYTQQPQVPYYTSEYQTQTPMYKTDQERFQPEQIANTVQREATGFFNWLFKF